MSVKLLTASMTRIEDVEQHIYEQQLSDQFEGDKREAIKLALDGKNFNQISKELNLNTSRAYKIRAELQQDFSWIYDQKRREKVLSQNRDAINQIINATALAARSLPLSRYMELYIYDYSQEAENKNWRATAFQDTLYNHWESCQKTCDLAPREHLKTSTVLGYITKKVHGRAHPLEINYYHLTEETAYSKFRKWQLMVESNPVLVDALQIESARSWKEDYAELRDGTVIMPLGYNKGSVGKHPHIMILDDVVDRKVMYSDEVNKKTIDRFYIDLYPMISKMTEDKRVIIVGTSQRGDDLYHSLPKDFDFKRYSAIIDDEKQEILSPDLFTYQELATIRENMTQLHGEKYWLKEYQNESIEGMGLIVRPEWIKTYEEAPPLSELQIYQGWDLSVGKDPEKGDYTVGATIGIHEPNADQIYIYVLNLLRRRMPFGERLEAIASEAKEWKPLLIGIEENVFQYDTVDTFIKKTTLPIKGVKSIRNKTESFEVELAPHFRAGKVLLHVSMTEAKREILSLPGGEYDDQADAIKLAIKISSQLVAEPRIRLIG